MELFPGVTTPGNEVRDGDAMTTARVLAALALAAPAWAYSYYLTDNLASVDPAKWSTAGALSPGGTGLAAPDPAGGL